MGDSAIHAVAGSVGGCISMGLTYPLVNLSTRAAVQSKQDDLTIVQAIQKTLKEEGLAGLYSGLSSSLLGIVVTNGVYYGFYEEARSVLLRRRVKAGGESGGALSTAEGILAGLIAGSITTLTTNPIWTIQTAQSTHAVKSLKAAKEQDADGSVPVKKVKLSMRDAALQILKNDGLAGFWRGIGPALVLVINPVIQYTTFERLVALLLSYRTTKGNAQAATRGRSSLTDWDLFILGAASKLVATGITYPYIVVKSRLQAATHKYKSSLAAVLHILQAEGLKGLYGGLAPKLIQSMLTAAFLFVAQRRIFEAVKVALAVSQQRKLA